jgi:hypothetical protein
MKLKLMAMAFIMLGFAQCKSSKSGGGSSGKVFKKQILMGVEIQTLELIKFPLYARDGSKWDAMAPFATEPDLYISMSQLGNPIYKSEVVEDCKGVASVAFKSGLPMEIRAYTNEVRLEIFDEDGISADDNVGYIIFRPIDFEKKTSFELRSADNTVIVKMGVRWIYGE